jgi:hypothetical protein
LVCNSAGINNEKYPRKVNLECINEEIEVVIGEEKDKAEP